MRRRRAIEAAERRIRFLEQRIAESPATDRRVAYLKAELSGIQYLVDLVTKPAKPVITELRKIWDEATAGPWYVVDAPWGDGTWVIAGDQDPHAGVFVADCADVEDDEIPPEKAHLYGREQANARMVATARAAVPALCDRVEFLEEQLRAVCEDLEHGRIQSGLGAHVTYVKSLRERTGL